VEILLLEEFVIDTDGDNVIDEDMELVDNDSRIGGTGG
jgi:hypothetical protein